MAEQLSEDDAALLFLREQVHLCHIGTLNYIFLIALSKARKERKITGKQQKCV